MCWFDTFDGSMDGHIPLVRCLEKSVFDFVNSTSYQKGTATVKNQNIPKLNKNKSFNPEFAVAICCGL
jgi:hypothetical protein